MLKYTFIPFRPLQQESTIQTSIFNTFLQFSCKLLLMFAISEEQSNKVFLSLPF